MAVAGREGRRGGRGHMPLPPRDCLRTRTRFWQPGPPGRVQHCSFSLQVQTWATAHELRSNSGSAHHLPLYDSVVVSDVSNHVFVVGKCREAVGRGLPVDGRLRRAIAATQSRSASTAVCEMSQSQWEFGMERTVKFWSVSLNY